MVIVDLNLNGKNTNELKFVLTLIIDSGDELISKLSNRAYDFLKMLEPFSLSRLIEINEDPEFFHLNDGFREHLEELIRDNSEGRDFLIKLKDHLNKIINVDDLAAIFGSFRIWGHPYIEVEEGLSAIQNLVRKQVLVDENYAGLLASDLAKICLKDHFRKTGQWGVDLERVGKTSPFYKYIKNQVWPTKDASERLPDTWHKLPLIKIYSVPTDINLSTLYADKSHSGTRTELLAEISKDPFNPIRSRKVLSTLLETEVVSPIDFLTEIAEKGLEEDHLIIGLREKEREMKRKGSFFTLMSWKLREYIVLTEFLIKKFFLPHFKGITMANGLTTLLKKMIKLTEGQSGEDRKIISIANHIDFLVFFL